MRKTRKFLAVLLIICMVASFAPAAFAEDGIEEPAADETTTPAVVVEVEENEAKTGVVATITVEGQEKPTQTAEGSITNASVNASSDYVYGYVQTDTHHNAGITYSDRVQDNSIQVTVTGDVGADGAGVSSWTETENDASAALTIKDGDIKSIRTSGMTIISQSTNGGGAAYSNASIDGDVSDQNSFIANSIGATSNASNEGTAATSANVSGNVKATGGVWYALGVNESTTATSNSKAATTVTVDGGITALDTNSTAYGIYTETVSSDKSSEEESDTEAKTTVSVKGDVVAEGRNA